MFANIILSLMNIIFSLSMSMVMYNNGVKKKKHLQPRMTLDLNVIIALYRYDIGRLTNKRPEGTWSRLQKDCKKARFVVQVKYARDN